MTGVSPLAKGPPPLVRSDKTEPHSSSGSASKKGSSSHSSSSSSKLHSVNQTSSPSCNSNGSLPSNLKTSQNLTNGVLKSSKNDEKSTGKHASSEKPSAPKSKQAKAVASSFDSKLNEIVSSSTPSESRSESPNSTSSRSNCSSTANAVTHPRRIQPKPVDHNLNYDTLIKSCTLNGGMKLNSFSFDRKAFVSLMQRPPLFMDPKLASQPIKNVLSGRGMPLIPEPASYLRPPPIAHQQQAIINLMHHHLQAMQSGHATDVVNSVPSMTPHQNNISSNKATSPRNVYNQSLGRSPSTPSSTSLKAAPVSGSETSQTMTSCSTKSGKHLVKSASSPKLPPKLGTAIPTAHIQPFMSKT
ncbi:hypothetical protein AB6A40_007421 [Gnathostoma spinigerum]|uniref:Uncharacterized protein n=1 Tax=Gnathostoma spinigerum TaxID=75299 RepID=A0ABD6END6_9BILA